MFNVSIGPGVLPRIIAEISKLAGSSQVQIADCRPPRFFPGHF